MTESAFINEFIAMGEARGRVEEARSLVLRFGAKARFWTSTRRCRVSDSCTISDREHLERISDRVLEATELE